MLSKTEEEVEDYSFLPIRYPTLNHFYNLQRRVIWHPEHIDYYGDRDDWDSLEEGPKRLLSFILFFFSQADGVVNENLIENFKKQTSKYKEAKNFYSVQEFMETIHNETYSNLIEAFIRDEDEKKRGRNAIKNIPSIRKIYLWMNKWMNKKIPLLQRVVAFACVEGILFSGAFAPVYWIKKTNKLKALCKANEWIARDEAIHTAFAVALYLLIVRLGDQAKLAEEAFHQIIKEAIEVSEEFIRDAIQVELIGLTSEDMISYVKCVADNLCKEFGYDAIYNVPNGCEWMATISLPNKTNFFEAHVTEYAAGEDKDLTFDVDADY